VTTTTTEPRTCLAEDLFGYPPLPACRCPGCGLKAEPFTSDGFCWLCTHNGQADFVRRLTPTVAIKREVQG
jgi:hypothetical protein